MPVRRGMDASKPRWRISRERESLDAWTNDSGGRHKKWSQGQICKLDRRGIITSRRRRKEKLSRRVVDVITPSTWGALPAHALPVLYATSEVGFDSEFGEFD